MKKLTVGIIGCGTIGSEIAGACVSVLKKKISLEALYDIDKKKSQVLASSVKRDVICDSLDEVFDRVELVIEAASGCISRNIVKESIARSKSVMIMSVGGLIDSEDLLREALEKGISIYLPSGAVCGIDALKAAKLSKIDSVKLTTRKPPRGLEGAPYLVEHNIDVLSIKGEKVVFQGTAREAVKGFPKNINVASLLCLAGLGPDKTTVEIITSDTYTKNTHEIEITGDFGRIVTRSENVPSRKNPKTSMMAVLSAIATLKGIAESVKIGT